MSAQMIHERRKRGRSGKSAADKNEIVQHVMITGIAERLL